MPRPFIFCAHPQPFQCLIYNEHRSFQRGLCTQLGFLAEIRRGSINRSVKVGRGEAPRHPGSRAPEVHRALFWLPSIGTVLLDHSLTIWSDTEPAIRSLMRGRWQPSGWAGS